MIIRSEPSMWIMSVIAMRLIAYVSFREGTGVRFQFLMNSLSTPGTYILHLKNVLPTTHDRK
jgi:hypothetical protein